MRRTMMRKLEKLDLPDNPLDTLIHELGGSDMVAELTGRKGRLERNAHTGQTQYVKRNIGQTDTATGRDVAMERISRLTPTLTPALTLTLARTLTLALTVALPPPLPLALTRSGSTCTRRRPSWRVRSWWPSSRRLPPRASRYRPTGVRA